MGLGIIIAYVFIAICAPLLTDHNPSRRVGRQHQPPSEKHLLGTNSQGKDVYAQFIYGSRTSMMVGLAAGAITTFICIIMGISAAYIGGKTDHFLSFLMNMILVIPQLPLLLVLGTFLGTVGPVAITVIMGLLSWGWGARVIRAQGLAIREKEFVVSAEVMGEHPMRVILGEILPNLLSIVGGTFIGATIYCIITEATLEFIGMGDPLSLTWGVMLYNANQSSAIMKGAYWDVLTPCFAIAILGAGLALLNFAVDEVANPQLRSDAGMRRWRKLIKQQEKNR